MSRYGRTYARVLFQDYNNHRPHTTLGLQLRAVHRRAGIFEPRSVRALN